MSPNGPPKQPHGTPPPSVYVSPSGQHYYYTLDCGWVMYLPASDSAPRALPPDSAPGVASTALPAPSHVAYTHKPAAFIPDDYTHPASQAHAIDEGWEGGRHSGGSFGVDESITVTATEVW
ncbi:uncharacterized protein PHACADRAFT_265802 [Phanerochaete carnosa HHB-10118-sp]|uniref:Uncharacterized protein n=1 Tax=Phanerochaete carnosa (strain HHB-10118-sp) TaxID=650164 RepID=K5VDC1_PHACS|nr:uncharacterized protein PHACADRAFT_265802 [Phanerochaete carnosa HHB-10118-sp]EKM49133.1 hypothetical protein PHACADRAFT_265802 [Phanerochaete carnosa HHB-10118-sp]